MSAHLWPRGQTPAPLSRLLTLSSFLNCWSGVKAGNTDPADCGCCELLRFSLRLFLLSVVSDTDRDIWPPPSSWEPGTPRLLVSSIMTPGLSGMGGMLTAVLPSSSRSSVPTSPSPAPSWSWNVRSVFTAELLYFNLKEKTFVCEF